MKIRGGGGGGGGGGRGGGREGRFQIWLQNPEFLGF